MIKRILFIVALIIVLFLNYQSVWATGEIDTRLTLASHSFNTPSSGWAQLSINVQAKSNTSSSYNVRVFQDAFYLDTYLQAQIPNDTYVTFSNQHFTSPDYNTTEDYSPTGVYQGRVQYVYTYDIGTLEQIGYVDWTTIVTVTIEYQMTDATSSITWYGGIPDYLVKGHPLTVDYTGSELSIPGTLTDFSLPVAMSNLVASASKEEGVTITWRTESELNSAGFHVWRSLSEDDVYSKITTAIIPSQGNTSVAQEYSYCDKNVESNVLYWYKVEEISTDGKSKFFGPISVMGMKPIPENYGLAQNYPNPFNPETMIEFQLPENADVSIMIYNLLGQEVKTLVEEKMEAGYQKITWTGRDNNGVKVPSGMYIVQMQAGNFRQIRKMTILR